MIKRVILKGLVIGMLSVTILTGGLIMPSSAAVIEVETTEAQTRAAVLEWHYKTVNGKTYRRLYDATNEKWLTDWILCE